MQKFAMKFKTLKKALQVWNKQIFGNIQQSIRFAEDELTLAELEYDTSPFEYNKIKLCQSRQNLNDKLETEEMYWRQKANIKWLREGDKNTKNFHQSVKRK